MAISIHNYTILDHLADYLLRIREAVQGDGSYQYVCVMERRCFNLVARFSPELLGSGCHIQWTALYGQGKLPGITRKTMTFLAC